MLGALLLALGGHADGVVRHRAQLRQLGVWALPAEPLNGLILSVSDGSLLAGDGWVFGEPVGGWEPASNPARLTAGGSAVSGSVAVGVSGDATVSPPSPTYEAVSVALAEGWGGSVGPSAKLMASDGAFLQTPAISGDTIVAAGIDPSTSIPTGPLYVFVRPSAGWSGTITESARLIDPTGRGYLQASISGHTVVAANGVGRVDVFTEPRNGWSGTIRPSATLADPQGEPVEPAVVAGQTVVAGADVFTEPARGWTGTIKPAARLLLQGRLAMMQSSLETVSDGVVAFAAHALGPEHACPCDAVVWVFTKPAGGWTGTLAAQPALSAHVATAGPQIALDQSQLFVGIENTITGYNVNGAFGRHVKPRLSGAVLTGLKSDAPRIAFIVSTLARARIQSVTLHPPPGLSFAHLPRGRLDHLHLVGGTYSTAISRDRLTIVLDNAPRRAIVTIPSRALREGVRLQREVRAMHAHSREHPRQQRKLTRLKLTVVVHDPYGTATTLRVHLAAN